MNKLNIPSSRVAVKGQLVSLRFEGESVQRDKDGRFSLNHLHRMAGSPENKDPRQWVRLDSTKALIEVVQDQQNLNVGKSHSLEVLQTKGGRTGGTAAIMSLALAYASYLSPEFRAACLKVVEERIEEEANPELGVKRSLDRAQKAFTKVGKDPMWIRKRIQGICTRHAYTSFVASRGCSKPEDFQAVTNALYIGVSGTDAKGLKKAKGLLEKDNLRDHLTMRELCEIELSEQLAIEKAERDRSYGVEAMAHASNLAGKEVHKAVNGTLRSAA